MMRIGAFAGAAVVAGLLVAPTMASFKKDVSDCFQAADADREIKGCTRLLKSKVKGVDRSMTYNNRGAAYANKGEFN